MPINDVRHKPIFDLESGQAFIILANVVAPSRAEMTSIAQSGHLFFRNCVLPPAAPRFVFLESGRIYERDIVSYE